MDRVIARYRNKFQRKNMRTSQMNKIMPMIRKALKTTHKKFNYTKIIMRATIIPKKVLRIYKNSKLRVKVREHPAKIRRSYKL